MFRDCWSADGQSTSNIPNWHRCFFQQHQNIAPSLVPQRIHDSIGMLVFGNHRVTVTQELPRYQARTYGLQAVATTSLNRSSGLERKSAHADTLRLRQLELTSVVSPNVSSGRRQ